MVEKVGRNDPCPCGSGKKYKACCMNKAMPTGRKKFTASLIGQPKASVDLMERTFGNGIARTKEGYAPSSEEKTPDMEKGPLSL